MKIDWQIKASVACLALSFVSVAVAEKKSVQDEDKIPGVTFSDRKSLIYVPARTVAEAMSMHIEKKDAKTLVVGESEIKNIRSLYNGQTLLDLQSVRDIGGVVDKDSEPGKIKIQLGDKNLELEVGDKKVEVNQATQRLLGTQGSLVVIDTNVSTGAPGNRTPNGTFKTGPYKSRYHYSRLYNNAPMPYSVQVNGNIFFHGYGYVPKYPASHGCIRVPLGRRNPARYLYNWIDVGVETTIYGRYQFKSRRRR
jgi:lipoprotein-anchoring transpeptidase ErfK/SrfK